MAKVNLKDMDVDALLSLRADVAEMLLERSRDLERQLALLGSGGKRRGRPAGGAVRTSAMKGKKVAPKYRGPGGETWAGRGATPRWLASLLKEGHSLDEFAIGQRGGRAKAAGKKPVARKARRQSKRKMAEETAAA